MIASRPNQQRNPALKVRRVRRRSLDWRGIGGSIAMNERSAVRRDNTPLPTRVTCPHCWHRFPPEEIKWIAAHSDLAGDPLLGSDAPQRFLPSRFNVEGLAIDVKGVACQLLACPRCHLTVPRAVLEMEPLFVSVLGAPGSGKSYFLASMTWR